MVIPLTTDVDLNNFLLTTSLQVWILLVMFLLYEFSLDSVKFSAYPLSQSQELNNPQFKHLTFIL